MCLICGSRSVPAGRPGSGGGPATGPPPWLAWRLRPGPLRLCVTLAVLTRDDFPDLGHDALLEHAPAVRVALQQRHRGVLGLLVGGVGRDRRDVGVGPEG